MTGTPRKETEEKSEPVYHQGNGPIVDTSAVVRQRRRNFADTGNDVSNDLLNSPVDFLLRRAPSLHGSPEPVESVMNRNCNRWEKHYHLWRETVCPSAYCAEPAAGIAQGAIVLIQEAFG